MTSTPLKFICLKWGDKYGPEYVNRLRNSLAVNYKLPFEFHCFTDDPSGLNAAVQTHDVAELRPLKSGCFTLEKLFLFQGLKFEGPYCLLDIDLLIIGDLTSYFESYDFSEPRFAICANDESMFDYVKMAPIFSQLGMCYVNSSFVTWDGDQLKWMVEFYLDNRELIEFKYRDLDTFLFHSVLRRMKFHPRKMLYSFNHDNRRRRDASIVIFNTSHGCGRELHQASDWVRDLWTSYSD